MDLSRVLEVKMIAVAWLITIGGEAISPACECVHFTSTFGKDAGEFSSPDFPRPYADNIACLLFVFIARRDQIVELTFQEFDLQKSHTECTRGDFVKLYLHVERAEVGPRTAWSSELCGQLSEVAPRHFSSGHAALLEFHSDQRSTNHSGFKGRFRFLNRRQFHTDGQKVMGSKCDYQFLSTNYSLTHGHFFSPRFPSSYPRGSICNYHFRARPDERIRLVFEELTLQDGDVSCLERGDVVQVWDGKNMTTADVIAQLCNTVVHAEVLSTGPDMLVQFSAMSTRTGQGFQATFEFQSTLDFAVAHDSGHRRLIPSKATPQQNFSPDFWTSNISSTLERRGDVLNPAASTTVAVTSEGVPRSRRSLVRLCQPGQRIMLYNILDIPYVLCITIYRAILWFIY